VAVNGDGPGLGMALYAWLLEMLGLARYEEVPPLLLSEGEKKRLALATVLMRRPRHGLLPDEPSLGQDTAHKKGLIRVARALAEAGQVVLLTTHDLPLAAQADRLMLLGSDGFVALGLVWALAGYIIFGALGGLLAGLTLRALRKAGFFAYLAEKR